MERITAVVGSFLCDGMSADADAFHRNGMQDWEDDDIADDDEEMRPILGEQSKSCEEGPW